MTCVQTRLSLREIAAMAFALLVAERHEEILLDIDAGEVSVLSELGGELTGREMEGMATCQLKGHAGLYEGSVYWDGNEDHRVFARICWLIRKDGRDLFAVTSKEIVLVPEFYATVRENAA